MRAFIVRSSLAALCAGACFASAHAQSHAAAWTFTLQHLHHTEFDVNDPGDFSSGVYRDLGFATLSGYFLVRDYTPGSDVDLADLQRLTFNGGLIYDASSSSSLGYTMDISRFHYSPTGGLTISGQQGYEHLSVQPDDGYASSYFSRVGHWSSETWSWNANSRMTIAPASTVPEPAMPVLMSGGLAMILVMRRRPMRPGTSS